MKTGDAFIGNIEKLTLKNNNFRKVLFTGIHSQLVLMSLKCTEDIGMEIHKYTDQFIRIEKGTGIAILNGKKYKITDGSAITIPAGMRHNIINNSTTEPLKLYTIYSPPHHKPKTISKNKPVGDHDNH